MRRIRKANQVQRRKDSLHSAPSRSRCDSFGRCRQNGISEQTFYRWKKKYGGMRVAEPLRLRQFEQENNKLKQLVADLSLDKAMLQKMIAKKT